MIVPFAVVTVLVPPDALVHEGEALVDAAQGRTGRLGCGLNGRDIDELTKQLDRSVGQSGELVAENRALPLHGRDRGGADGLESRAVSGWVGSYRGERPPWQRRRCCRASW